MKRRDFIHLAAIVATSWSSSTSAQNATRKARIGILTTANPRSTPFYQAFEQRMRELGYIDGRNIEIEYRNAGGAVERLPDLARELVALDVNALVTATDPATRAARDATSTIPIVMIAVNYDPLALGYISGLARPGGNITGVFFQHLGTTVKRFELLKEMLPQIRRVAVLADSQTADQLDEVQTANQTIGVELQPITLRGSSPSIEDAVRAARRADALFALESASIFLARGEITALALRERLPSFAFREQVAAGGLFSYGVNFTNMWQRAAEYIDKIIRGANPADLPGEQSTRFELVINMRTANALGVAIPPTLLARADEVIE